MIDPWTPLLTIALGLALAGCGGGGGGPTPARADSGSSASVSPSPSPATAERVDLQGYDGDVMEPFLSRDGQVLFFNDRNEPGANTDLHLARAGTGGSFVYQGRLEGANSSSLDAVASMDVTGRFVFVSPRDYGTTFCTLFSGVFAGGAVTGAAEVPGTYCRRTAPWLTMDAEISADGSTLYFADTQFDFAQGRPVAADVRVARRNGEAFDLDASADALLESVNTPSLEYAPATTPDQRTLYFTRLLGSFDNPDTRIMVARRNRVEDRFGPPEVVPGITGLAEAATVAPDGRTLYFHRLDAGTFRLYRLALP